MSQLQITRRHAARPPSDAAEPLTEDLRTASRHSFDASVVAMLAHIDEVLCASR